MADKDDVCNMFDEWLKKLQSGIDKDQAMAMCESTRMVLAIGSILNVYFPGTWNLTMAKDAIGAFKRALTRIGTLVEAKQRPNNQNNLYLKNITSRLNNLVDVMPKWCPAWRDSSQD